MDDGPWTALGTFTWFVGVWAVMMAAMMLPSAAPVVALYAHVQRTRSSSTALLFAGGYLVVWIAAGVAAFAVAEVGSRIGGGVFAWDRAGRWLASGTLAAAAVYELTPLKDTCLARCRSPLGFLVRGGRGPTRALLLGARHGAWCLGCCGALMASLFALGVMSITWTAFVAALVAVEKLLPWERVAPVAVAAVLGALAVLVVAAPHAVPGLTIPNGAQMPQMEGQPAAGAFASASRSAAMCDGRMPQQPPRTRAPSSTHGATRPANAAGEIVSKTQFGGVQSPTCG
jgi:predicted metal-binding membrane protein